MGFTSLIDSLFRRSGKDHNSRTAVSEEITKEEDGLPKSGLEGTVLELIKQIEHKVEDLRIMAEGGIIAEGEAIFPKYYVNEDTRETYRSIEEQLLKEENGEELFGRWVEGARTWAPVYSIGVMKYIEASAGILERANPETLAKFGDYSKKFYDAAHAENELDLIVNFGFFSEALWQIAENFSGNFDLFAEFMLDYAKAVNYDKVELSGFKKLVKGFTAGKDDGKLEIILQNAMLLFSAGVDMDRYFESCKYAAAHLEPEDFAQWIGEGMKISGESPDTVKVYFSSYSRFGQLSVRKYMPGVGLDEVKVVLQLYSRALSGQGFILEGIGKSDFLKRPHIYGNSIFVPERVSGYGSNEANFLAYKVIVTIQAAKSEFGTFSLKYSDISDIVGSLEMKYDKKASGKTPLRYFYSAFNHPEIAETLFELIEGKRIIGKIKRNYRGIRTALDEVVRKEMELMPHNEDKETVGAVIEDFARYIMLDKMPDETRDGIKDIVKVLYGLSVQATLESAAVGDSVKAAAACYEALKLNECSCQKCTNGERDENKDYGNIALPSFFFQGSFEAEGKNGTELGEEKLEGNFVYPQWHFVSNDYFVDWCKVNEIVLPPAYAVPEHVKNLRDKFVEKIFEAAYRSVANRRERYQDGEEIDIDAAIELFADKKAGSSGNPNIYLRRKKQPRGFAAAFLIDASPSALNELSEGRRVIDAERETLELLMLGISNAGHKAGIFGYSGLTRRDVRVYVVKRFEDEFDRRRLYTLEPVNADSNDKIMAVGTYTGPAVRHMSHLLSGIEEEIRILFLLTDSGHQAWGYDADYARADVHKAFLEAKKAGIRPFAISYGDMPKYELEEIYGRDFIVVKDAIQLAGKLPEIYVKLTR